MIKFSNYVADSGSHRIRNIVIDAGGVTTVAEDRIRCNLDDPAGAKAQFSAHFRITAVGTNLYADDSLDERTQKIQWLKAASIIKQEVCIFAPLIILCLQHFLPNDCIVIVS